MIREILEEINSNESVSSDLERELDQVMQTTAADAQAVGLSLADTAIDSFDSIAPSSVMKEWNKLSYKEKLKLAKKLAKQY